jgi:hypothetical protein
MLKDFGFFQRIFLKIIFFAWWNSRVSIILLFALRYFWINVNGKAAVWAHSLFTKRKANLWGKGRKTCYNLTLVTSSHLQAREREREREIDCWDATQNVVLWFCMISPTGSDKCLKFDLLWLWVNRQWACQFDCFVEFISFCSNKQRVSNKECMHWQFIVYIYIYEINQAKFAFVACRSTVV